MVCTRAYWLISSIDKRCGEFSGKLAARGIPFASILRKSTAQHRLLTFGKGAQVGSDFEERVHLCVERAADKERPVKV